VILIGGLFIATFVVCYRIGIMDGGFSGGKYKMKNSRKIEPDDIGDV